MIHLIPPAGRLQGLLLALAIVVLPAFTASDAKDSTTGKSTRNEVFMPAAKPDCGGLTVTGPSSISRGGSGTFYVTNWTGQCLTWYYNGTYTNTSNGSFTLDLGPYDGGGSVTAIQHSDCTPYGSPLYCGVTSFSVY